MNKRTRSIRARVSPEEHRKLTRMADTAGVTQSEFIRILICREEDASRIEGVLNDISGLLKSQEKSIESNYEIDPFVTEAVLILRELAVERHAQVLNTVNIKLDKLFGVGRVRL